MGKTKKEKGVGFHFSKKEKGMLGRYKNQWSLSGVWYNCDPLEFEFIFKKGKPSICWLSWIFKNLFMFYSINIWKSKWFNYEVSEPKSTLQFPQSQAPGKGRSELGRNSTAGILSLMAHLSFQVKSRSFKESSPKEP